MALALRAGGEGNTGDGLQMASDVGAGLADMEFVKGTFGISPFRSPAEEGAEMLAVYKGAIAVNGYGRRFIERVIALQGVGGRLSRAARGVGLPDLRRTRDGGV